MVSVEFRVLKRDGTPVLDLKPEEITLKVGGRVREIVALELIKAGGDTPPVPKGAKAPPPPPFLTNGTVAGGRVVMLVVDDEAIEPGHEEPVRLALNQLIDALTPGDRVGLVTVRAGTVAPPTARHDLVRADIAGLRGREGNDVGTSLAVRTSAAAGTIPGADSTCRTRMVHDALMNQFESAAPSVPTLIVLVSNSLAAPSTTSMTNMTSGSGQTGACDFTTGDLAALTTAATLSRAHVYGLEVFRGADVSAGMENFASLTGNARVRLTGDTKPAIQRIANETLAYYAAAFEVPGAERNGSTQRVTVTVPQEGLREGVEVKAQPTVTIPRPSASVAKVATPKVRDLLSARKSYRDLPLRATVHTSRASRDGKLRVVCVFDSSDPEAKILEAGAVLFDTAGKARAQWTGQPADFKALPVVAAFSAPGPGSYRLRLVAVDASGAVGSINEDVRVEQAAPGTPQLSALVLGTQSGPGFAPRLQFADEQAAIAMVEVYGVTKASTVEAKFEFAASEDGPAEGSAPGTVQSPRDDIRMAFITFPVQQMPPGDFVVRAVVTVDGKEMATKPSHTLRKVER